jgi:catecholate siderophore receptor
LAPSLAFGLQGATRFSVGYQLVDQNDRPDWGVPGSLMEGMINYDPAAGGDRYRDRFYGHRSDYDDVLSHAVVGRFEHDLSFNLRLRNVTRWSDTDREALYTVPNNYDPENLLATTQRQAYVRDNGSLSNLTNLESTFETGGLRHTLIAGFEATADNSMANRYPTNNELGNPGPTPISNPDPDRPLAGFVGLIPGETADIDLSTVGTYLYDTVQLSRKWLVNGGFRVERYGVSIDSRTAAGEPQGPDGYDRTDVTVGAKAGLVFKPVDRGSFYASISSAPLPPASFLSTPDISREGDNAFPGWEGGPNNAASDVQRATNLELGTKWNVHDDRLTLTAAAFRTKRSNIAMAGTVDGESNTFAGYGEQVLRGVELGATGSLTRAWSIYGGMLLMDSERRHGPEVDAARIAANPGDYGPATTTNGDELAFTPHFSANLWTTYEMPFGLTLGGGVRARTASYVGRTDNHQRIIPNGTTGKLPGFTVLDLMASYRVNRNFTLRFNADNITDHFYPLSSNWPARRIFLGPARNFRISTDVSF